MMLAGFWADWGLIIALGSMVIIMFASSFRKRKDSKIPFYVRLWRHCLPELDLFESGDRKSRALDQAWNNWQTLSSLSLTGIMALFAAWFVLPILYSKFPLVFPVKEIIDQFTVLGISLSGIWLTRAHIRRRLRQQLISDGFLICEPCGYDLRGQTEPRCPECGATFDKKLLTNRTLQTEDSSQHDNSEC